MRRIGIDVGGTNTDAVLIEEGRVIRAVKAPTSEDVTTGILDSLKSLGSTGVLSGKKIDNLADFYRRLWSAGDPGVEVTLKVLKGAEVMDVKVRSIDRAENIRKKPTI